MKLLYVKIKHEEKEYVYKCKSFLRNFVKFIASSDEAVKLVDMSGVEQTPIFDFSGTACGWTKNGAWIDYVTGYSSNITNVLFLAPEADSSYGIIVGEGDKPFSYEDYALQSQIQHSDTGLYYYATALLRSGNAMEIRRAFENKSASDITIKEIGLAIKYDDYYYLLTRDLISHIIPSGEKVSVSYFVEI